MVRAILGAAGDQPIPLLKSGAVGVRELRRIAGKAGCAPRAVRLSLALGHQADLVGVTEDGLAPTPDFDAWTQRPLAERLAVLVSAWAELAETPFAEPTAAWRPGRNGEAGILRSELLSVLGEHAGAGAAGSELAAWLRWRVPLVTGGLPTAGAGSPGDDPTLSDGDPAHPDDRSAHPDQRPAHPDDDSAHRDREAERLVTATLDEATWLGVVGAGALAPTGRALQAGEDIAAAVRDGLGQVCTTARFQADLTAITLGPPAEDLSRTLDAMADREEQSTATVWRFSPESIRRAMDSGLDREAILSAVDRLAEGPVPQPLGYLVGDVARRHGTLRGGDVACYLRSDDQALVAEVAADRKLRSLGLRQVAPGVLVGIRPLEVTLAALRAAGHAPVEEGEGGVTVFTRPTRHRAPGTGDPAGVVPPARVTGRSTAGPSATVSDPEQLAQSLLDGPDDPHSPLLTLPTGVIDLALLDDPALATRVTGRGSPGRADLQQTGRAADLAVGPLPSTGGEQGHFQE